MRNSTSQKLRIIFLLVLFMCCLTTVQAQVKIPFALRKNQQIKGDITMIGNNIVNRQSSYTYNAGTRRNPNWITVNVNPNDPYPFDSNEDGDTANDSYNMRYIDIDGDGSTFSSSKATLTIPDLTCSRVAYAALYWSATYRYNNSDGTGGRDPFNVVKLKLPGASAYTSVTGTTIFDGFNDAVAPAFTANSPYACYADVTALLQGLTNPNGEYTVADIKATQGTIGGGVSGGWNLFVIYENPKFPGKYIASFDGFAGVNSGMTSGVDVTYNGFTTVPAPLTVNAKLAAAALEGDNQISGDKLQFKSGANPFNDLSNSLNPATNFFNANITTLTDDPATPLIYDETIPTLFTARTPNSANTLGFDSDLIRIPSGYLPNSATSATLKMISTQDTYYMYFNALAIDVIEPDITLVKTVENAAQQDIGGQDVTLGAELTYVLTIENIGNDHAVGTTITDILPVNTSYMSVDLSDVPGAIPSAPVYNPVTGRTTVVFSIPDALLKKKGTAGMGPRKIKIKVKVAETCNELTDRCANIIQNSATIAYHGFENTLPVTDTSVTGIGSCGGPVVGPANFLVDVDNCIYSRNEILCGPAITLTAGDGYDGYQWFMEAGATDIPLGTTQSISVNTPGEYYVNNDASPPCVDITEHIIVSLTSSLLQTNPVAVAGIADDWGQCANDGRVLANIFLCGINDSRLIPSGVSTGTVSWQKFNASAVTPPNAACSALQPEYCPHNAIACESGWQQVATGPNFTANASGEYRMHVVNGGCFVDYYFNVYKNNLDPQVNTQDIVCTTPGEIKVVNVPAGYEYRLLTQAGVQLQPAAAGTYAATSVFPIAAAGVYKVELRQAGVTDGCLFEIPNIGIAQKAMTVNVTKTDKTCSIPGSINIQALGVDPQYTYKITGPGGVTVTHGPLANSNHLFTGLNPGTYAVEVTTEDGCLYNTTTTITDFSNLTLNAVVTQSPSCDPGYITLTPSGGQPSYSFAYYSINGTLQNPGLGDYTLTNPVQIASTDVGTYIFIAKDANGCTVQSNPVTIANIPPITTTSTSQNVSCNGANDGSITFTITSNNGITTFFELLNVSDVVIATNSSGIFNNLAPGSYSVVVVQQAAVTTCRATPVAFTITQPAALTGTSSVTTPLTCNPAGATITAGAPSGGTSPYQYSINGTTFVSGNAFTGLGAGTYTLIIRDARNCTFSTTPITLTAPVPVTNITFSGTAVMCSALTSDVTLTGVGGLAPFTYAMTAPSVINNTTNATFAGLSPGTYAFTVTDAKGCTYTKNYTVDPITLISVVGAKVNDVRCFGSSTGALTYTVSGFGTSYNYAVVSTGTTVPSATGVTTGTINLTGLAAGTYTITVTNPTTNCTATAAVTIANPTAALTATKNVVQPTCVTPTGSLTVTASNGWGGYSYALTGAATVGPQASPSFTGLAAGSYNLAVTDANGCVFTDTFTITAPVAPVLAVSASDLCIDANGTSITVAVNSGTGTGPFQYSLDGGTYQNGATFTALAAGSHTITVRDANGCTSSVTRTINPQLTATTALVKGLTCTAPTAAQITVTIGGGSGTYNYEVKIGAAAFTAPAAVGGTVLTYNAATANTYQFRITDTAGCIITTGTTTIAPITPPQFTFSPSTAVKCFGDSTGALAVNITPGFGTPPYAVAVTNTTTSTSYGTQTTLLPAGNYSVTVTDANGCTATNTTAITQPTAPIAYTVVPKDITCNNPTTSFGEIRVENLTGGTAPFTYYVSNNFGTNLTPYVAATGENHTFIVVNFGIYTVNVVDANGCSLIKNNYVIASPPSDLNIDITAPTADCTTGGSVTVTVTATVLSNNYEFGILTQSTVPYSTAFQTYNAGTPTIKTFTGLTPGVTYTFVVHDLVTDCYYFKTATGPVPTLSAITATATATPVTCTGAADGKVSFTMSGYSATTTQVDYQIFRYPSTLPVAPTPITGSFTGLTGAPATVNNLGNLAPGDYYILFTEVDGSVIGCSKTSPVFTITESTLLLQASAVVTKNDNCNTNAGIITASAQYGTAPYSYQLVLAANPAPTVATWAGQASPIFTAEGGTYIVYVKDANNCIRPTPANVVLPTDVSPALTAVIAPGTQCTTAEGDFVINVTRTNNGSLGPFLYSLDGGAFQVGADSFSYSGLTSGVHTIQIQDKNGCTMAAAASVTIYPPVNVTAQPTVQPTCPANVGTITATGTGGSGNYEYELQDTAGTTIVAANPSPVFAGQPAGSYKVVISDTTTLCTAEALVTLDATVPVTFTTTKDDVNCNGGADGSITIILPNTNTDIQYTYTIDGALSAPLTQNTPIFTGLAADTYVVTVTSGKACTATASVTITEPLVLDSTASVTTAFACAPNNTVNTATVTVAAVAGTGTAPYTYSIDGGANYTTSNTFAIANPATAQTLSTFVKDSNGCTHQFDLSITPMPAITSATAVLTTAIECDDNLGVITITAVGGSGDFTFAMLPSGTPVNTAAGVYSRTFNITAAGIYTFKITDDVTGCSTTVSAAEVMEYNVIDAVATASTPVVCFGSTTGTVTVDVLNYTGAYTYQVYDGATLVTNGTGNTSTITIPNVSAGNLFVRITATATPFCSADTNIITVGSPASALAPNAAMTANVTCTNDMGEIVAQATGGWGSYQYELVNTTTSTTVQAYAANNTFTGLTAGNYTVSVRDSGNCIASQNITLTLPPSITAGISQSATAVLCNGDTTASVQATGVAGGQGTYQYVLNVYDAAGTTIVSTAGPQPSPVFTGLGAGIYSIKVVDGWGCDLPATTKVTITQPTPLVGYLTLSKPLTCTTQAEVTISATGGTAPYTYSTDGVTYTSTTVYPVVAGAYTYYVKDNNGCAAVMTNSVEVPAIEPLNLNLNLTAAIINCSGGNNALITTNATGGLGSYQYTLLNVGTGIATGPVAIGSFPNLSAGTYRVTVNSGDCNVTSADIPIANPTVLASVPTITNIECFGQTTGSISFATTGGTPDVQYAISPNLNQFVDTNVLEQLAAGFYDVVVQDKNGCFILFTGLEVTQPTQIEAEITIHSDETCLGEGDGTIDIYVHGGSPPYQYSLDNYVTHTDITGTYDAVTGVNHQIENLTPGTIKVWVRDANGCSIFPAMTQEILTGVNLAPQVTVDQTCVANAPNNNVTISVTLTGNPAGVPANVTYSIDGTTWFPAATPTATTYTFNNVSLGAGTYTAYAKHTMPGAAPVIDRECTQTVPFTIVAHNAIAATAAVKTPIACNGGTGEIEITVTSSTGTLEYAMGPTFTFGSSNVFSGLVASVTGYDFRVKDALGCEFDITGVVLSEPTAVTASVSALIDEICFGDDDGTFTVTPSGGTPNYQVSIDGGTTFTALSPSAVIFPGLAADDYTVVVKDANGCSYTIATPVTIAPGADLQASINAVQVCDETTITVSVNPLEAANVTYYLDGVVQATNPIVATGLTAGSHTIDVTHTNGCNANFSFNVAPIVPIVMGATSKTDVLCFGGTSGTATVTVTGGTAPLTYAIAPNVLPLVYGTYQSSNTFTGLSAGDYVINVKDGLGCESPSATITVSQPAAALAATATHTNEICINANDGSITVTPTDGTGPYRARINGGAYTTAFATSTTFSLLAPGNYTVDVIDANNCTVTITPAITITPGADLQPSVIVDPYCQNNVIRNIALISDAVFANVGQLTYSFDGGAYTSVDYAEDLAPGTHTYGVQHANGCIETGTFTVPTLLPITASVTATTNIGCFGDATGAITVTATGGTGTLSYAIADADVLPLAFGTPQSTGVFTGLTEGNYVVNIIDDNLLCETQVTATLTQPTAALTATAGTQTNVLCYGNATGSATVNVTGGTTAYSYSWNTTPVQTTATATGLIAGTYTVTVTDANLCTTTQSFTITQPTAALTATAGTQTNVLCYGNATGSATVNVTGGTTAYSYSWNTTPVQTTATATGLTAGTYTVTVTDANGCTATQSFTITQPTAPLSATVGNTQTNVLCYGNATGTATVNVTGGTGIYSYSWDTTPVQTTATATGLTAGTYTVTVTDANGCTATQSFTITQPAAALAATAGAQTNVLCYGNATGAATVNVTGGTTAYSYSWNTIPVQTTATATGLIAGTYTVTVTDANFCTTTQSFTITQPAAPLSATVGNTQTNVLCYGNATGTATVNVTGGTTAYSYSWNTTPVQTTATATSLIAGTYIVTVTDANLCTTTQSFTITEPAAPLAATAGAQTNILCYGNATGTATVNVTGGTGTYSYSWDTTPVQTTATATGLTAGTYTVTVTDANGCTTTQSFTITQPAAPLAATAGAQTNILCYGNATGTATVNVTGGTVAYSYSWDTTPVQTTATATGLTAGTYTVTITDANLCTTTQSFTITQPAAPLSATVGNTQTNILCYGNATGTATVNVTGGTGTYSYSWDTTPVQTTATATGLTAGTYTVTVTDANLCTTTQSFTITQPAAPLSATAGAQTNVLCQGNATGSAIVNVTGGTVAYSYSWNTTPVQTTATATSLTAGTYTVTVTDANGCTATQSFTITEPAAPLAATVGTQTNVLCYGNATGLATVNVTGGTGTYTYNWNTTPVQTTATATGLTAGTYTVTVTDANFCTTTQSFTITQPAAALVATTGAQTNILCYGNATGAATVNVTGGTGTYTYNWNTTPVQTTATATGLTAGTYTVTVTDASLCTTTHSFTITQPAAPLSAATGATQTNVLCFGNATGSATVNVTGGTVPYTYSWDTTPVQTTATATGLTAGTYTVTVTDANLCTTTQTFTITQPATALTAAAGTQTNVLCFGAATGSATIVATGGTGAYTYSWNTTPVQTTATATGLTAGNYQATVTDANGCTAIVNFTITQPATGLSATAASTNEICLGANDGSITVTPSGGVAPYEARINLGAYTSTAVTPTFANLAPGNYTIDVRDANGCTFTVTTQVTILPGVNLQASLVAVQNCNDTTITLSANAAIPASSLTYALDGGAQQPYTTTPIVLTGLTAGNHSIVVTHSNGCPSPQLNFTVAPVIPIVVTGTTKTDVNCFGGATGTATVTATGGTAPLTYAISANVTPRVFGAYQASATFTGLAAGDYVISVKDALNCKVETPVINVIQPVMALSATVVHTDESCLNDSNGTITVTPSGGTPLYSASLNGGPFITALPNGTIVFNGLAGGTYTIQVRDANGCLYNGGTTTVLTGIVINPTVTYTQNCDKVTVVVGVNAGVAGQVTYSLDGGTPQFSNTFPDVVLNPAVTHTVTVTHVQGCSQNTAPFTINAVAPIVVNASTVVVTNIACHGKDVGSIVVNATGGTGPLQYAITWDIWPTAFYGTSNTFNDLLAGDYTVHVKDAMGCTESFPVTITEPAEELLISAAVGQHESCTGAHDGSINITMVQGGTPPYSIALDSPLNFQPYDPAASPDFANLYGRTLPYEVYVRDASGCYAKAVVTIEKGVSLVPNIQTVLSCVNNAPVNTVTATLNTIVNNVEYKLETATGTLIQDFSTVKTWTLAPGNYVYTVRHINGCQKTFAFTVQPRVPITVTSVVPTDTACNGGTDGTLTVTASGGSGNLQYGISPDYVMSSNPVFTGLTAGTYTVRVQDQYGCYVDFSNFPPVGEPALLAVTDTMNLPEACIDDNDGAFEIEITGGTAPYATSLDANGPFVADQTLFDNLDGGTYTVYIQDAKGCTFTHDVILISPLDIDAKAEVVYNCDQNTVTIVTNGAVNQAELNYSIVGPKDNNNPPQTSNIFANLEDGNYTVEVTNTTTGCTDTTTFTIISVPDLAIALSMSGLNQFQATVVGGQGPYQYTLDGDSNGSRNVFTYFRSGIYVVTVTDSRGCTKEASIEVKFVDIIIPDVVSPDGDGQNDTWSPGNTANYPKINSDIFDRYGRKLATLKQGDVWDGTYDGHPMPTGDYWFLIDLGDAEGRTFVGHFTIYR